ncbi:MAG: VWA domain-containing protein, partial [Oscillospiraceae bacterium]|nr:VWA domain-containing protein [Oscillospiraceae bacterium]
MSKASRAAALIMLLLFLLTQAGQAFAADAPPSAQQILYAGGVAADDGGSASVSKTVQGTAVENVFDITLTVQTEQDIEAQTAYPPLSVVLLMDVSNTMKLRFGSTTRYKAAMAAAEQFLQSFAAAAGDGDALRQVGFAAFNTDGHIIFPLSDCRTEAQVQALSAQMRADTSAILNQPNYGTSPYCYTNIEAGLKLAGDMLAASSAPYKVIILLSDGRPTTYLRYPDTEGSYEGWNPIMKRGNPGYDNGSIGEAGYFYNQKRGVVCYGGTNYSDRAADRASARAAAVRQSGIGIYAVGVGLQALSDIATLNPATIDCYPEGVPYVVGTDVQQYTAWLRDSIASGYYYDTEDSDALQSAYADILAAVTKEAQNASLADWVINDAMNADADYIEFLGFYAADGSYAGSSSLVGSSGEGAENTAVFDAAADTVSWDLKNSGYSAVDDGAGHTVFHYTLRYRVRLKNEAVGFAPGQPYTTNGTTVLRYRLLQNGELSQPLALPFPIPQVTGYLGSLRFQKTDAYGDPLAGAVFTLAHDPACESCAALAAPVNVAALTAASAENGETEFSAIPSGHSY